MEFITERVSIERRPDGMSVVISNRLPSGKFLLLAGWLVAWTFCGGVFIDEAGRNTDPALRVPFIIMIAFWAYFELRILRVVLWRTKGFELWQIRDGEFTIKDSLFGYGKANRYFVANIQRFGLLNLDETSWKWQMSDSFWTRGGERLGFEYQGKKVAFGRGLTKEESDQLVHLVGKELKRERKTGVGS